MLSTNQHLTLLEALALEICAVSVKVLVAKKPNFLSPRMGPVQSDAAWARNWDCKCNRAGQTNIRKLEADMLE